MGVMADYREKIKKYFDKEIGVIQHLDIEAINKVMNVIAEARQREATIYTMGNGGVRQRLAILCVILIKEYQVKHAKSLI